MVTLCFYQCYNRSMTRMLEEHKAIKIRFREITMDETTFRLNLEEQGDLLVKEAIRQHSDL